MITAEQLTGLGACAEQVAIFREEWPNGADVTLKNCLRAAELDLDLIWAGNVLSRGPARKAFYAATISSQNEVYDEVVTTASKAYNEALCQARISHLETMAQAGEASYAAMSAACKAFNDTVQVAWEIYAEAMIPVLKAFNEAIAQALYDALTETAEAAQ